MKDRVRVRVKGEVVTPRGAEVRARVRVRVSSPRVGLRFSLWWMGSRPERKARREGEQTKKA